MSRYLDNDRSRAGNLNENYGREFLELHSVGVDAGYGPEDIIAVSRIFTGWGYTRTQSSPVRINEFTFRPQHHDTDDKLIPFLNTTIAGRSGEAGVEEGHELITIVSNHPSTRTFICGKLVQLLVNDMPPQNFIDNCAAAWGDGGDVKAMLRAILLDPEYITNPDLQRSKAKTPLEYTLATLRALRIHPRGPSRQEGYGFFYSMRRAYKDAGYNVHTYPAPTGLAEVAKVWGASDSMIARSRHMTGVVDDINGIDEMIEEAGLETAEEAAAYLLALTTADRFRQAEFEEIVRELKGADGIFEPRMQNERDAFRRAIGLLIMLPSYQLQ